MTHAHVVVEKNIKSVVEKDYNMKISILNESDMKKKIEKLETFHLMEKSLLFPYIQIVKKNV